MSTLTPMSRMAGTAAASHASARASTHAAESFSEFFGEGAQAHAPQAYAESAGYGYDPLHSDPEWAEFAAHGIGLYEVARIALPSLAEFDDDEVDAELAAIMAGMSEAEAENFLGFMKNAARGVLGVAAPVAGIAGRIIGTAVGGPVGTMIGGVAGDLVGQGAQALNQHLGTVRTPGGGQRRRGSGRRQRRAPMRMPLPPQARAFVQQVRQYAPTVQAGVQAMTQAAAPAVGQLAQQLQEPQAGAALGQAAGQQIANVAGTLSGIINAQEMQLALSNVAAGLPAVITNAEGVAMDAAIMAGALREAILEASDILEAIEVAMPMPIGSGELAEFVGA